MGAKLENQSFNERQHKAVQLVREKGRVGLADLKHYYSDIDDRTLRRDLQGLMDKNILI